MPRDLTFQALKLLAQYIVSNDKKIPEGELFKLTSCMNPDDAEMVGMLHAVAKYFLEDEPELQKEFQTVYIPFFEEIGISKWVKGELSHLGFRAGTRYEEQVDMENMAKDEGVIEIIDEAKINASTAS